MAGACIGLPLPFRQTVLISMCDNDDCKDYYGLSLTDPELVSLLDRLIALNNRFPYSSLHINSPNGAETIDLFAALCHRAFENKEGKERALILESIKGNKGLASAFLGFIYTAAEKLRQTGDFRWLKIGLGASILQAEYPDERDYLLAMAELYVAAEEAGLDPRPFFALVGYDETDDFGNYTVVRSRRNQTA